MATIFTRAKAAKKVIHLLYEQCGIRRSRLRCDSRLETDLGIYGDDAWDVLLAMRDELGVDMSGFDCGDSILPESTLPAPACLAVLFIGLVLYAALHGSVRSHRSAGGVDRCLSAGRIFKIRPS